MNRETLAQELDEIIADNDGAVAWPPVNIQLLKDLKEALKIPNTIMTDDEIKSILDNIDFASMVTIDDLFYLIARSVETYITAYLLRKEVTKTD